MKIPVWFTRALNDREVTEAREKNIEPVVHPLISIRLYPVKEILRSAKALPAPTAIAFSSKNAVDAFLTCKVIKPDFLDGIRIFCLGEATAARLKANGYNVTIALEATGTGLAGRIASEVSKGSTIWHFCSNIKRPETGNSLEASGVRYYPLECYETIELTEAGQPEEPFKAVVFYSPSAVRAFVKGKTKLMNNPIVVSIGETTADELRANGFGDILTPHNPTTEALLDVLQNNLSS